MFATTGTPMWQIGDARFDMDRIDVRPRLNTTERWSFVNNSARMHPMHLHGVHYKVLSRTGGPIHEGDQGWKDTYPVAPGETVTIQPYFAPRTGRFVFHCHNLEHEDQAMMRQMQIV
jgi:FtsP/CotA-like multicopper oxidase with cupredoxin domain